MNNDDKRKKELIEKLAPLNPAEEERALQWESEGVSVLEILERIKARRDAEFNGKLHNWLDLENLDN